MTLVGTTSNLEQNTSMKKLLPLLIGVLLLGAGCTASNVLNDNADLAGGPLVKPEGDISLRGTLQDVTGGQATGNALVDYFEDIGRYDLLVYTDNLPELEEGFFYEGWVVRKLPLSVISTGPLTKESASEWTNVYTSDTNLTDHVSYVLTLEPDDDDPAPAEHILEGELK